MMRCTPRVEAASKPVWRGSLKAMGGFTLLEVLMALGLSVMLLVAVYSALNLHYRYSTMGREDMQRAQIARALLQRMATDIRSVVYRQEEQSPPQGDSSDTGDDTTTNNEIDVTEDPVDAYTQGSVGVSGSVDILVLHISQPIRSNSVETLPDGTTTAAFASDLQSVAYFMAGSNAGTLQELVLTEARADGTEITEGLARMQGDRLAIQMADASGDLQSLAGQARILAEEVIRLEFHYFDGVEWLDEWDSVASDGLPLAIEITIGFRPPDESSSSLVQRYASASTEGFRLVVALPLANAAEVAAGL